MNFRQYESRGMAIDGIAAIIIIMIIVELISWLLEITGNSFYIFAAQIYTLAILVGAFAIIESHWGPIIISFIYWTKFSKKEMEAFGKLPVEYPASIVREN